MFALGAAVLGLSQISLNNALLQRDRLAARFATRSGFELADAWLRSQSPPPETLDPFDPFGGEQTLPDGSRYRVLIEPDPGNVGRAIKKYTVWVEGHKGRQGAARLAVQLRMGSFANYAYFTDEEISTFSRGRIWFIGEDEIHGPVHSNDTFHIRWDEESPIIPIFFDSVTSASHHVVYNPTPHNDYEYSHIFRNGRAALHLETARIELPEAPLEQLEAAWGSTTGLPSEQKVYIVPGHGIYVEGNVERFEFLVYQNKPLLKIDQPVPGDATRYRRTYIQIDEAAGVTRYREQIRRRNNNSILWDSGVQTQSGIPNGSIFVNGHIYDLRGTVKGQYTVTTNVGKDIHIKADIRYATDPLTNPNSTDRLGLVAQYIVVDEDAPWNLRIDAVLLAGSRTNDGAFYYAGYRRRLRGTLTVVGGVIQKSRGPVGMFSYVGKIRGYTKDYHFDERMKLTPPPYFPATGVYEILAWQEL